MNGNVCACGQPAPHTTICGACAGRLARDLGDVPAYARELDTVLTKQTRYGDRGDGSRPTTRALPFDPRASEASWVLRNTLVGWVRVLDEDGADWPAGDLAAMSRWLLARVDRLARHEAGDQAADEIDHVMAMVRRVVDRPADLMYLGNCDAPLDGAEEATTATVCHAELYAVPGRRDLTCRACGASYDVEDRATYVLAQLEETLASATEIARAFSYLGQPVTAAMVRGYGHRKRLDVRGLNLRGDPLYRIGDVRRLLRERDKADAVSVG